MKSRWLILLWHVSFSLFMVTLAGSNGNSMENATYPKQYPNRNLGLTVALLDVDTAPMIFTSLESTLSQLRQLRDIGFDTVIVGQINLVTQVAPTPTDDPIYNTIHAAGQLGMEVLLLPPRKQSLWGELSAEELVVLSDWTFERAQEMITKYGELKNIAGWVLPYEIDDQYMNSVESRRRLGEFIASLCTRLRSLIEQECTVTGIGKLALQNDPPTIKQNWNRLLDDSTLDVLIVRDGIGEYGEAARTALDDALYGVVRGADECNVRIWGGIETYELPQDRGDPLPASSNRINRQLTRMQAYTERLVALPVTQTLLPDTADEYASRAQTLTDGYKRWYQSRAAQFPPSTPIVFRVPRDNPAQTISGSFSQIIGTASYFSNSSFTGPELDRMKAVGITTIIPDSTYQDKAYFPSRIIPGRESNADALSTIIDECGKREMYMFLSLPHFDYSWVWQYNSDDRAFVEKVIPVIQELHTFYGDKPGFGGWYIPYELCDAFLGDRSHRRRIADAFGRMADECHRLAPGKPVMISPYFTTNLPDDQFSTIWNEVIELSHIDALAMQDSVGALNVSGTETLRLQYLPHYINLFADLCEANGVEFWWNVETFSQTHGNPIDTQGWSATTADFERVRVQIHFAALRAKKIINFDFPHYFSPGYPNSTIAARNRVFYDNYKAWYDSLKQGN